MGSPYISLILPAYNEARTIKAAVELTAEYLERRRKTYEIIVPADGTDETRDIVREIGRANPAVKTLGTAERRGKGRGVREAVAISTGSIIGYADADNKVPIEEFDKIEPWLEKGYDAVIGSRASEQSQIEKYQPFYRRVGSIGFHVFMQTVVGLPGIQDSQCGFKFFTRQSALRLFRAQQIDGYMFDVEILALAIRFGLRIQQVPIRWRDDGDSRLMLVRGNLQNVRDIFRIRYSLHRVPAGEEVAERAGFAPEG